MKKVIIIALALTGINFTSNAQNAQNQTASAAQSTQLALSNAIAITFMDNGTKQGNDVNLVFSSVSDYANGVESDEQKIKVQSNKNFNVTIKSDAQNFTYSGSTSPSPVARIADILKMKVTSNQTGGSLSYNNYASIPSGTATIINWGSPGGNRTFSIKYKATPGFALPAGTYTANIIYTAVQP